MRVTAGRAWARVGGPEEAGKLQAVQQELVVVGCNMEGGGCLGYMNM